jgi:hypothetical protein
VTDAKYRRTTEEAEGHGQGARGGSGVDHARDLVAARTIIPPDDQRVEFLERHLAEINAAIRALTPRQAEAPEPLW